MKVCPKCLEDHEKPGTFCSRSCANSRVFSEETRRKKSSANKAWFKTLTSKQIEVRKKVYAESGWQKSLKYFEDLMIAEWDTIAYQSKRLRVIVEQEGCCNHCGISEWNETFITLEFEHKDGNHANNNRNNVEAICPNCHSQTETWRGRNNRDSQNRVEKYVKLGVARGEQEGL